MFPNFQLLKLVQKSRPWLILTISLGFFSGLLTIFQARYVSQIVSRVFLDSQDLSDMMELLQLTLVLFTLRAILAWGSSISAKVLGTAGEPLSDTTRRCIRALLKTLLE